MRLTLTRTLRAVDWSIFSLSLGVCVLTTSLDLAEARKVTVGEHVDAVVATPHPYRNQVDATQPGIGWTETIHHPEAAYIAPFIRKMELAPGDVLVIRSPDGKQRYEYRGYGRQNLGRSTGFYATHIKGDTAILELHTTGLASAWGVEISHYGRGYSDNEIRGYWALGLGKEMNLPEPPAMIQSICTADDSIEAKCYQSSEPEVYDKSRAVARLLLNGRSHCTGWLVGCEGHVMTNEHCVSSQSQANNIDIEFMAEGASCAADCSSSLACPGTIEASGANLVAVKATLDYALLLPNTSSRNGTDLPGTYGYLQLREEGPVVGERLYIPQHPAGWGKRVAMASTYPGDADGYARVSSVSEAACSGGTGSDVGYWADTQGGSSGSPVLSYDDHRVIALHHCRGSGSCRGGSPSSDDPNRGIPIQAIISDLSNRLPQCSTCQAPGVPFGLTAVGAGDNRINLTWGRISEATSYELYRATGTCDADDWTLLDSSITTPAFSDATVSGEVPYAYKVVAVDDATVCKSQQSACVVAETTGVCTVSPRFEGLASAESAGTNTCGVELAWAPSRAFCGSLIRYNIYRDDVLLAACVEGNSYLDTDFVDGREHTYTVRAEDASGLGAGPCAGGNEDTNAVAIAAAPAGPDTVLFSDDVEGSPSAWVTATGPLDGGSTQPWSVVTTDGTPPNQAWFVADESSVKDQVLETVDALAMETSTRLEFWHRFDTEVTYDGGVLEYTTDGGATWLDIGASRIVVGGYTKTLSTGYQNPLKGRQAWSGSNGAFERVEVDLSDLAGQSVKLRWRMGCDSSVAGQGWWVDNVRVIAPTACQPLP